MAGRFALLIGTGSVRDGSLPPLATAPADVRALAAVLRDPYIAGFDPVVELVDASTQQVGRELAHILDRRHRDDFVLLYYSGHALFDDEGQLHLAMPDTELDLLSPTSISAAFVAAEMDRSRSRRQLLILDCRLATGLAHGASAATAAPSAGNGYARLGDTGDTQRLANAFHTLGRGRVIFAGCDGTRDSAPGFHPSQAQDLHGLVNIVNSPFTHALVEGLRGPADSDRDGRITIDELYSYAHTQLGQRTPWLLPSRRGEASSAVPIAYAPRRSSVSYSAAQRSRAPKLGSLISDRYRTLAVLDEGGLGVLFAARDERSDRAVALRCLRPPQSTDASVLERFLREAQVASAIDHPNVVRIHELGFEGNSAFIVMEPLDGESLGALLRRKPRLELAEALEIILPAMAAVGAAHTQHVRHGDVNPDNIFVNRDPSGALTSVKVLGFGLSNMVDAARSGYAEPALIGSPHYMPPEQLLEKKQLDLRADVYAFGVILYEALTGQRPFQAENHAAILFKIGEGSAEPLTALRPELPAQLEAIVQQAMAKQCADRYASMDELRLALQAAADRYGWTARDKPTPASAIETRAPLPSEVQVETPAVFDRLFVPERAPRSRAWMLGVALFGAAGGAAGWLLSGPFVEEPTRPAPIHATARAEPMPSAQRTTASPLPPPDVVANPGPAPQEVPADVPPAAAAAPSPSLAGDHTLTTEDSVYSGAHGSEKMSAERTRFAPTPAELERLAADAGGALEISSPREARRARAKARAEARRALARESAQAAGATPGTSTKIAPLPEHTAPDALPPSVATEHPSQGTTHSPKQPAHP